MSEKEYKDKCEMMFKKNAILINENEQLKQQIEKMKCCGNCEYYYCSNDTKGKCNLKNPNEHKCGFNICEKWEL